MEKEMMQIRLLAPILVFLSATLGLSQEMKDERILVDEIGVEGNIGLPYLVGLGATYSLKIREVPVYPSFTLKVGIGPIAKVDALFGINYSRNRKLAYSINFGHSGGGTLTVGAHSAPSKEFVGMAINMQRKKYLGDSKYWCVSQSIGLDYKKPIDPSSRPEFTLYPYFELGLIFMLI